MTTNKSILTLLIGVGAYILGQISTLTIIFLILIFIDYLTGTLGSIREDKKFSKKVVRDGLIKKGGYLIFWLLAVLVDLVIIQEGPNLGLVIQNPVAVIIATCWLIGTEGTSILANLQRMGVIKLPGIFGKFFEGLTNANPDQKE